MIANNPNAAYVQRFFDPVFHYVTSDGKVCNLNNTDDSALEFVRSCLKRRVSHYNQVVRLATEEIERETPITYFDEKKAQQGITTKRMARRNALTRKLLGPIEQTITGEVPDTFVNFPHTHCFPRPNQNLNIENILQNLLQSNYGRVGEFLVSDEVVISDQKPYTRLQLKYRPEAGVYRITTTDVFFPRLILRMISNNGDMASAGNIVRPYDELVVEYTIAQEPKWVYFYVYKEASILKLAKFLGEFGPEIGYSARRLDGGKIRQKKNVNGNKDERILNVSDLSAYVSFSKEWDQKPELLAGTVYSSILAGLCKQAGMIKATMLKQHDSGGASADRSRLYYA